MPVQAFSWKRDCQLVSNGTKIAKSPCFGIPSWTPKEARVKDSGPEVRITCLVGGRPGPKKYVNHGLLKLLLEVLGHCFTYMCGHGWNILKGFQQA